MVANKTMKESKKHESKEKKKHEKGESKSKEKKENKKQSYYMPLDKSKTKKAFNNNVKKELEAGKPIKQALAISYAVQRQAKKK